MKIKLTDDDFEYKVSKLHCQFIKEIRMSKDEINLAKNISTLLNYNVSACNFSVALISEISSKRNGFKLLNACFSLMSVYESISSSIELYDIREIVNEFKEVILKHSDKKRGKFYTKLLITLIFSINKEWERLKIKGGNAKKLLYRDDTCIEDIYLTPLFEVLTMACY
ncbi:hypothetical protein D3C87_1171450 [compost metagenome]